MHNLIKSQLMLVIILLGHNNLLANTTKSAALSYPCAGCHGADGVSTGSAIPSLAGLSAKYIKKAMIEYKNNKRNSTIMDRVAKGYSNEDIKLIAEFFSKKPVAFNKNQTFNNAKAIAGKKLHKRYCRVCHYKSGTDGTGLLSGNSTLYLKYSLEDFLSGHRNMPRKMKYSLKKAMNKDPQAIDKLLEYYKKGK